MPKFAATYLATPVEGDDDDGALDSFAIEASTNESAHDWLRQFAGTECRCHGHINPVISDDVRRCEALIQAFGFTEGDDYQAIQLVTHDGYAVLLERFAA